MLQLRRAILIAVLGTLALAPAASAKHRKHHRKHHRKPRVVAYYTVDANTPTLGEVALFLYGKARYAADIARWNHLRKPYALEIGQRLALRLKPHLSPKKGRAKLLAMWRERLSSRHVPKAEPELPPMAPLAAESAPSGPEATAPQSSPSPVPLTPERMVAQGSGLLEQGHTEEALAYFRRARTQDPKPVEPWFLEFSTLRTLQREDELRGTVDLFLKSHPSYRDSQVIRLYLAPPAKDAD